MTSSEGHSRAATGYIGKSLAWAAQLLAVHAKLAVATRSSNVKVGTLTFEQSPAEAPPLPLLPAFVARLPRVAPCQVFVDPSASPGPGQTGSVASFP